MWNERIVNVPLRSHVTTYSLLALRAMSLRRPTDSAEAIRRPLQLRINWRANAAVPISCSQRVNTPCTARVASKQGGGKRGGRRAST